MTVFSSAYKGGRPVRLSENTRHFADVSLHGRYGTEAVEWSHAEIIDDGFDKLSDYEKYDRMIRAIVTSCPVRITEDELICGSATYGLAIRHVIPVKANGNKVFDSVSHLTCAFDKIIPKGLGVYEREIDEKLSCTDGLSARQTEFLNSVKNTLDSFHIWHERYLEAAKDLKPRAYDALTRVPFGAPTSFYDAVQSLWFCFAFLRLCGNWPGIGRIDQFLGGYLKCDLENGVLTLDEAREILASFFVKGCEWIEKETNHGSGDAQHYQNIVLGGIDTEGNVIENEVTHLVLDIVEELPIGDFPITVRVSERTSDRLLRRIAEVQRHGSGVIAVYNEDTVMKAMTRYGYTQNEARKFANDGCWETQVPGCTYFRYMPFDSLAILLNDTLKVNSGGCDEYASYEELYEHFRQDLGSYVRRLVKSYVDATLDADGHFLPQEPSTAVALFETGCIEHCADYREGGPTYCVLSPHIGGAPDVGNSLSAIDLLVYKEKKVTLKELIEILKNDWEGNEALRAYARSRTGFYGNDDDAADDYTVRVLNDFADITAAIKNPQIRIGPGVSTFGRQIEWRPQRSAVPFGFRKDTILSGNCSPTPGTDSASATAIIRSYCKADLTKQLTGAALDIKLLPSSVDDENGVEAIKQLILGFVRLGGYFMQTDVIDAETLKAAQADPQAYKTLSVRVSGWNARFVTLNKEWQDMIIQRTTQGI